MAVEADVLNEIAIEVNEDRMNCDNDRALDSYDDDDGSDGGSDPSDPDTEYKESESDDEDDDLQFLYDGSNLRVKEFFHLFAILGLKHCLSDKAKKSILKLFRLILPEGNNCPSLHLVEKATDCITAKPKHYTLCSECHTDLHNNMCTNNTCEKYRAVLKVDEKLCYYVMDVKSHLTKIVKCK